MNKENLSDVVHPSQAGDAQVKLTQFSHGGGCGCKIAPDVLERILHSESAVKQGGFDAPGSKLIVGYGTKDDAAVYDIGNGQAIISTTDFFMPIVNDAFDFGQIASANSISDVFAMGGKPLMALAVLGWPVNKLSEKVAQNVLEGARKICTEAGIPLAGGHSIDSPEPIFGLAVTGIVAIKNIKKNSTAIEGCKLFLTKPLGVGMITTAQKRAQVLDEDFAEAVTYLTKLNSAGYEFGKMNYVKAMTDVTGFGLLGHLIEMCEGSNLSAEIRYADIPLLSNIRYYTSKMIYPDSTFRNWKSYEKKVTGIHAESILTLCDPQTNGGLLVAVTPSCENDFIAEAKKLGMDLKSFGVFTAKGEFCVSIK